MYLGTAERDGESAAQETSPEARGFISVTHSSVLAGLVDGLMRGLPGLALTGTAGSGKTTMADLLRRELLRRGERAFLITGRRGEPLGVREIAARLLGKPDAELEPADTERLFEILTSKQSGRCVLIIDDAENLANSVQEYLRLVSQLALEAPPQFVLVGRPLLLAKSPRPSPLMDAVATHWELGRLGPDQSREFLRLLLGSEAMSAATIFEDDGLDALVLHGKGVYGRMVSLLSIVRLRAIAEAVRDPAGAVRLTAESVEEAVRLMDPDAVTPADSRASAVEPAPPPLRTRAAADPVATPQAKPAAVPVRAGVRPRYAYVFASVVLLIAAAVASYGVAAGDAPGVMATARQAVAAVAAMAGAIPQRSRVVWSAARTESWAAEVDTATDKVVAALRTELRGTPASPAEPEHQNPPSRQEAGPGAILSWPAPAATPREDAQAVRLRQATPGALPPAPPPLAVMQSAPLHQSAPAAAFADAPAATPHEVAQDIPRHQASPGALPPGPAPLAVMQPAPTQQTAPAAAPAAAPTATPREGAQESGMHQASPGAPPLAVMQPAQTQQTAPAAAPTAAPREVAQDSGLHQASPGAPPLAVMQSAPSHAIAPTEPRREAVPAQPTRPPEPAEVKVSTPSGHLVALVVPAPGAAPAPAFPPGKPTPEPAVGKVSQAVPGADAQAVPAPRSDTMPVQEAGPSATFPAPVPKPDPASATTPQSRPDQPTATNVAPASASPEVVMLLARADGMLQIGDIVAARLFFEQAAELGSASAALATGKTFDPSYLGAMQATGISPDPAMAARWYRKAAAMGDKAGDRLAAAVAGSGR